MLSANGGKGTDQAVAAAKLSAGKVIFAGQGGQDDAMRQLKASLDSAGVDLRWKILQDVPTGRAFVTVDD